MTVIRPLVNPDFDPAAPPPSEHAVVLDPGPGGWPVVTHVPGPRGGHFVTPLGRRLDVSLAVDPEELVADRAVGLVALYLHRVRPGAVDVVEGEAV